MDSRIHLLRGCPGADSAKRCDRARRAQAAATVSLLSSRGVPRCHRRRRNQHPFSREGVGCGERGEGCRTRLPRSPLFFQTAFRCSLTGATRARGFSKAFAPATGVLFNPLSPHHVTLKEKLHGEKKRKEGGGSMASGGQLSQANLLWHRFLLSSRSSRALSVLWLRTGENTRRTRFPRFPFFAPFCASVLLRHFFIRACESALASSHLGSVRL